MKKGIIAWLSMGGLLCATTAVAQQAENQPPPQAPVSTQAPATPVQSTPAATAPVAPAAASPPSSTSNEAQLLPATSSPTNSLPAKSSAKRKATDTQNPATPKFGRSGDMINLDFVNVDIPEITKSISELTKRNFILDDKVHGKITIISPKPVSVEEAYQAFISALSVQGFAVIPAGRMLKIVPLRDMKNNPIPTDVERALGGDDAFVTRLIPIRYVSAAEIVKSLRNLLTKNGDVMSYDPTNTLIITDSVGNIRRLERIIQRLDQKGYQESLEIIKLRFASAADVVQKVMQIFDLKDQRPPSAPGVPEQGGASQFISKILPDDRTNSIIVLANQEGIRRVREVVTTIDSALEADVEKGKVHVYALQYADATELVGTLASLTGGGGSSGAKRGPESSMRQQRPRSNLFPTMPNQPGAIPPIPQAPQGATTANLESVGLFDADVHMTADVPTNSLVITASSNDYKALLPIILKLDVRRPQAFVEAMILEVDVDKALDVGIANHIGKQSGDTTVFAATNFADKSSIFLPTSASALQGLAVGVQGRTIDIPVAGGQNLTIPVYGSFFRALQTNGTINVLSTPNILTSDNKEAEIVVGQVVPFITAQGRDINNQPINQIQRENVAITLRVTPQINESDDITMDIFQEIQDLVPGADVATFGPTTSTRTAKTTVLVKDAQTVTIGGLIADREQDSISKVPVLGDIPLLGWFFKNKVKQKRKISLAIFLTPHIIRAPEDLERLTIEKNETRQRFLEENNMEDHPGLKKYKMDKSLKLPPPKANLSKAQPVPADSPSGSFLPSLPPTPPPLTKPEEPPMEQETPVIEATPAAESTPPVEAPLNEASLG